MAADPITKSTIDDLLDYNFGDDDDDDDPFADRPARRRDDKATLSPRGTKRSAINDDKENLRDLGLDEEVTIKKRKIPNPKLDEQKLLSEPGIPKLRALSRSGKIAKKLHFKGKGHEFSDVARLLNYYQLWLDDLFPRAKLADGLVMVEKVGHSKRMQIMRKEWINEGKPGYARDRASQEEETSREKPTDNAQKFTKTNTEDDGAGDDMFFPDTNKEKDQANNGLPEDDELDALMAEEGASSTKPNSAKGTADSEGEDDLDALLAAQATRTTGQPPTPVTIDRKGMGEDDDLDALLVEQETRNIPATQPPLQSKPSRARITIFDEDDETDEDDLDALLADQEIRRESSLPLPQASGMSPHPQITPPRARTVEAGTTAGGNGEEEVDAGDILSSPLPNNPEEEELAEFLSSPIMN